MVLTMASGEGRVGWLSRRALTGLINHINTVLKKSHPAGEGHEAHDTVMALEHIGARSQIAAQANQEREQENESGGAAEAVAAPETWMHYLVTEARVEAQGEGIIVAVLGQNLPADPDQQMPPEPIAGLALTRPHCHEILRLMRVNAEKAQWDLKLPLDWMGASPPAQ